MDTDSFSGTPGLEAVRILLGMATASDNHAAICRCLDGIHVHTAGGRKNVYIVSTIIQFERLNLNHPEKQFPISIMCAIVWKLKKQGMSHISAVNLHRSDSNVRMSIHVDDPLGVGAHVNVMRVFQHLEKHLEAIEIEGYIAKIVELIDDASKSERIGCIQHVIHRKAINWYDSVDCSTQT
eukprot:3169533-Amphidinium_carterae.2